ncbi:MAG: GNAT family N-acetyltransferase, partial [Chloroflexi bacterium]|nr:GNAT family N-acetyltransferase [Chloroflexota bacterium]
CVIAWAFRDLGLEKVIAKTDLRNARSTRVMEKLGMTLEAHLRSHVLIEGVRQDEVHYGLLRQEWESQQ